MNFKKKYSKYKNKYLFLQKLLGGQYNEIEHINEKDKIVYLLINILDDFSLHIKNLMNKINEYKNYTIILIGNFNTQISIENNNIYFDKKTDYINLDNHNVLFNKTDYNSTCNMKIITSKINKEFKIIKDNNVIIALYPKNNNLTMTTNLYYLYKNTNNLIEYDVIENMDWCSEYIILKSKIKYNEKDYVIISLDLNNKENNLDDFCKKDFIDNNSEIFYDFTQIMDLTDDIDKRFRIWNRKICNTKKINIIDIIKFYMNNNVNIIAVQQVTPNIIDEIKIIINDNYSIKINNTLLLIVLNQF
jgi:hypothetical protein